MDSSRATPDYIYDSRHRTASASRRPSKDSSIGTQHHGLADMVLSAQDALNLSPLPPHMPTPVMAPQQVSPYFESSNHRQRDDGRRPQMGPRDRNPFYEHSQFRQYRTRQEQKEEKDGQKWPPILEDPFLDGRSTLKGAPRIG